MQGNLTNADIRAALEAGRVTAAEVRLLRKKDSADKLRVLAILGKVKRFKERQGRKAASVADRVAALTARRADIGPTPPVADAARRESCRLDLPRFLSTYMPSVFYRPFDTDALALLADIQEAMLHGGRKAIARPRGSGKTAISLGAVLWAALYAHRRYLVFVAATGPAAAQMIADAQAYLADELIAADFPEVCHALECLDGKAQRCKYQSQEGKPTKIEIKRESIVFPSVTKADGLPNENAGVTIQAASITGAVRGMHRTDAGRKWIRPDFVLLDDPQTRESAMSQAQTDERERIVNGDVMGLAGHDKRIAAIMTCTVICRGDLSERFLNHERHAEWRGQRTKLVDAWGGTEALWKEYDEIYRRELAGAIERGAASEWYASRRAELESGSSVMCSSLISEGEVSALQHARNYLVENGELAFSAECQNEPLSLTPLAEYTLDAEEVLTHVSGLRRYEIPESSVKIVAGVDLNRYALSYCVCSVDALGGLAVIDYGFWTPKGRHQLWEDGENREAKIAEAVGAGVGLLLGNPHYGEALDMIVIDAGFSAEAVYGEVQRQQRLHRQRRIYAAKGQSGDRYEPPRNRRILIAYGESCDVRRVFPNNVILNWDSHFHHIRTQKSWKLGRGVEGETTLFGTKSSQHRVFAEQVTADVLVSTKLAGNGRTVAKWETNRHNEMGDCLAMCSAAATIGIGKAQNAPKTPTAQPQEAAGNQGTNVAPIRAGTPTGQNGGMRRLFAPMARSRNNWATSW